MNEQASTTKYWVMGVIAALVLVAAFVAGIFFFVMSMMKGSEAYRIGMARFEANAQAVEILGPPISTGFIQGKINTTGPEGVADISIPVKGQKARGTIYVEATMRRGLWKADAIELEIDGVAQRIDLLQ